MASTWARPASRSAASSSSSMPPRSPVIRALAMAPSLPGSAGADARRHASGADSRSPARKRCAQTRRMRQRRRDGRAIGKAHRADAVEKSGAAEIAVARLGWAPAAASSRAVRLKSRRRRESPRLAAQRRCAPGRGTGSEARRSADRPAPAARRAARGSTRYDAAGQMRDRRAGPAPARPPASSRSLAAPKPSTSAASQRQTASAPRRHARCRRRQRQRQRRASQASSGGSNGSAK